MRRPLNIALLVLALLWIALGVARFFRETFYGFRLDEVHVAEVFRGARVLPGDRLLLVDGRRVTGSDALTAAQRAHKRGEPMRLTVRREGKVLQVEQPAVPRPQRLVAGRVVGTCLALLYLAVGTLVALRPTGRAGQLFFLFCVALAVLMGFEGQATRFGQPGAGVESLVMQTAKLFAPAFFLHFFLLFPHPHPLLVRYRWGEWFLYVPALAFLLLLEGLELASRVTAIPDVVPEKLDDASDLFVLAYFLWAMLTFVDSYRRLEDPLEKEKLRWVVWGVVLSMLPIVCVLTLEFFFDVPYLELILPGLSLFIPLAFGYAILSHRIMDIEVVLNRGLVYSAITIVLVIIFIVVENVLAVLSLELTGRSSFALAMSAAVVMAALVEPIKRRMQSGIDRLFFAYKVKLREGLRDLAEELSFITDLDRMEHLLLRRLVDLAHAWRAALFLRDEHTDSYVLTEAVGVAGWDKRDGGGDASGQPRAAGGGTVGAVDGGGDGRAVSFDANDSFVIWLLREARPISLEALADGELQQRVEPGEAEVLRRVDAALVLPLRLRGDLIGFILLSRRRNRELFNRDEVDLLNRLAIQAASDLTNARLQTRSRRLEEELRALREELLARLRGFLAPGSSALEAGAQSGAHTGSHTPTSIQ